MRPPILIFRTSSSRLRYVLIAFWLAWFVSILWRQDSFKLIFLAFNILLFAPSLYTFLGRNWIVVGNPNWGIFRFDTAEYDVGNPFIIELTLQRKQTTRLVKIWIESERELPRFLAEIQRRGAREKLPKFADYKTSLAEFDGPFESGEAERDALYRILGREKPKL